MTHYTVNSKEAAWTKANQIIPCDYLHDSERSRNAGYDIYFSTRPDCIAWISDLGNRLEVNLPNGESVNIWIEEEETEEQTISAEEVAEMIEATNTVKEMTFEPLFNEKKCEKITLIVDGYSCTDEAHRRIYEAIRKNHPSILWDILERYAETHGKKWAAMWGAKATHYGRKDDPDHGHYIIEGYIELREGGATA